VADSDAPLSVRAEVAAQGAAESRCVRLLYVGANDVTSRVHDGNLEGVAAAKNMSA
jgi:hypothetical protein